MTTDHRLRTKDGGREIGDGGSGWRPGDKKRVKSTKNHGYQQPPISPEGAGLTSVLSGCSPGHAVDGAPFFHMESDLLSSWIRWRHQIPDRLKDHRERPVVLPFQFL